MPSAPVSDRLSADLPAREPPAPERQADHARRDAISVAAERAFVRHGFHAATMQQVAEEAGMSAGNLYRYFPSKEALVEGICLFDQRERGGAFHTLAHSDDLLGTLEAMLRENVLNKPRHKTVLFLEITAEAARNPRVAEITRNFDTAALEGLSALLNAAKANGGVAAHLDADFVARTMFTLVAGLFKRLAVEENFDRDREAQYAIAILKGLFSGAVKPEASLDPTETK